MSDKKNPYNPLVQYPLMIVISGPSGVGKDTVIEHLQAQDETFYFVVTATTRPPRPDEIHGRDYLFVSRDDFAEMIENNELIEYAVVYTDFKGIPKAQVRDAMASGRDVLMRIDVQGAATIRKLYQDALLIFLTVESEEELVHRLQTRKADNPDDLKLRIATARRELERVKDFDYVVINYADKLDETVETIKAIIHAEHHRTVPRQVKL